MPVSLEEYASKASTTRCLVCNAPDWVREQIEANEQLPRLRRISRTLVVEWATHLDPPVDISVDSIYKHTANHHSR